MDQPAPKRSSLASAWLAALAIVGSAVGVTIYQLAQKEPQPADTSGFDISSTQESPGAKGGPALPLARGPSQSGLGMLQTGNMGKLRLADSGGERASQAQKAAQRFTEAVRATEARVRAMAISYTRRYPSIAQYGRDWMSYPDLKQLNDDYMRDHDPVKFLRGLARSRNFGKLVAKYSGNPAVESFVKEGVKQAPGELTSAAMELLKEDGLVKNLVANTASALGLPPALTAGLLGGGKVDEGQVMGQIMRGNPDIQKAIEDPNRRQ